MKELNLSQEQAQKLVELQAGRESGIAKQFADAAKAQYEAQRAEWRKSVTDEYGTRMPEVRAEIGRALNLIPENVRGPFRQAMDVTGVGDNPAFIKAFHALAKLVNDGKPVTGNPAPNPNRPNGQPVSHAQAIYGDNPSGAPQSGRTA